MRCFHLDDWIWEAERRAHYAQALEQKESFSKAGHSAHWWLICVLPQQCGLTVVCWMWHRGVVLQMAVGVVGYVGGEAVAPRPGRTGS